MRACQEFYCVLRVCVAFSLKLKKCKIKHALKPFLLSQSNQQTISAELMDDLLQLCVVSLSIKVSSVERAHFSG